MPGASTYACQQHKIYARTLCKSRHAHAQYVQNVRIIHVHFGAFFIFFNFKFMYAYVIEGHQKKPMPRYTYQCVKTVGGHAAETEHVPEG